MRLVIKDLQANLGTTTLYVTHDQVEAMTMADRLIVLKDGIAEQIGTPMELYDKPETEFVAGFIGSPAMNFVDATISSEDATLSVGNITLPLPTKLHSSLQKVTLGFRPEHITLNDNGLIPLKIILVEHLGSESVIHAKLADSDTETLITLRINGNTDSKRDDIVKVSVKAENYHFFDPQSGNRIN
jgi:ABC-type sugar transport system ATPase subunit